MQSEASLDPAGAVLEPEHGVHEVRAAVPLPKVLGGQLSHSLLWLYSPAPQTAIASKQAKKPVLCPVESVLHLTTEPPEMGKVVGGSFPVVQYLVPPISK